MKTVIAMKPTGGTRHFYVWNADYEAFRLWCYDNNYEIIKVDSSTIEDFVFRAFFKERKNRFKKRWKKA
jgi:hypothetical protein